MEPVTSCPEAELLLKFVYALGSTVVVLAGAYAKLVHARHEDMRETIAEARKRLGSQS